MTRRPACPQPLRQLGEGVGAAGKKDGPGFQLFGQHLEQGLGGAAAGGRPRNAAGPQGRLGGLPHGEHLLRPRDAPRQRGAGVAHRALDGHAAAEDRDVRARRNSPRVDLEGLDRVARALDHLDPRRDRRRRKDPRPSARRGLAAASLPARSRSGPRRRARADLRRAPGRPPRPRGRAPERSPRSVRPPSQREHRPRERDGIAVHPGARRPPERGSPPRASPGRRARRGSPDATAHGRGAGRRSRRARPRVRVTIASAPCPTAGRSRLSSKTSTTSARRPRRARPARASTSASNRPSCIRRIRVSTLPRASRTSRSGRAARTWACRRGLEVPTRAPRASSAKARRGWESRTSRGSSRGGTAAIARPSGIAEGTSFKLCTATSIRPSSRASSSSFVKSPFHPIGAPSAERRSPVVRIVTTSTAASPPRAVWTSAACARESALPRAPSRSLIRRGRRGGGRPRRGRACAKRPARP